MMKLGTLVLATMATAAVASADTIVTMHLVDEKGVGAEAGTITISESKYGLVFTPALRGLAPGLHGFHVHENPSCAAKEKDGKQVPALAAGGHLDPAKTGKHAEPWGDGHLGDLPPLYVAADGTATQPLLGPRLKVGQRMLSISLRDLAWATTNSRSPGHIGQGKPDQYSSSISNLRVP